MFASYNLAVTVIFVTQILTLSVLSSLPRTPFAPSQSRDMERQMAIGQSRRLTYISTPTAQDITSDPFHRFETQKGRWALLFPFTAENEEAQEAGHGSQ